MEAAGERIPLGTEDARILSLGTGPIRGHTLKVLIVDDAPGEAVVGALRTELAGRLPSVKRWRQRLVAAPEAPTGMAWQDDPELDITHHVRAVAEDHVVGEDELRRIVAEIMMVELDHTRPLWTIDVVPRLADGRWAIIWKIHHCLADGVTVIRAGSRLLWTGEPPGQRAARTSATTSSLSAKVSAGMRLATITGYRGLVLREFRRVWRLSPLAAEVGPDRVIAFARCTLDELRTLGKAIAPEVTINDVLLASVAGALRRWLHGRDSSRARLKVQVPVSMHVADDDPFGNKDSFLFVELPVGEADAVARVRAVANATGVRKHRHDARAIYALRHAFEHAPAFVRRPLQRLVQGPHEYSLNISNVPGPTGPIRVLGHRVEAMYSLAEIAPQHALRVSAVSLNNSLFIGLCADSHVIPDLDVIAAGIRASIDELRAELAAAHATATSAQQHGIAEREPR